MRDLTNKYVVVTGAGKGIGRAIAERMLAENAAGIAVLDYDEPLVQATAAELDPTGARVFPVRCDISNPEMVQEAFKKVYEKFGRVDVLVNNAGITRDAMAHKMTPQQMHQVMDVNFFGTYNCIYHVVPEMRKQEYGKIVNISSTSSYGNVGQANYSASKAGLIGMSKSVARKLASRGITCNVVAPGFIESDMTAQLPDTLKEAANAQIPMKRMGTPEEVAQVCLFLAGDAASYMTGNVIAVDGGLNM